MQKSTVKYTPRSSFARLGAFRGLPGTVWVLGFVSMFMDISPEVIHCLAPVLMASVFDQAASTQVNRNKSLKPGRGGRI